METNKPQVVGVERFAKDPIAFDWLMFGLVFACGTLFGGGVVGLLLVKVLYK